MSIVNIDFSDLTNYNNCTSFNRFLPNGHQGGFLMANRYLLPVFKELYGNDFNYSDFNDRMEMQKAIYLLQDMGVPVGDYGFRWYLHGPYSQALQDDMYYENGRTRTDVILSQEYSDSIAHLREIFHSPKRGNYSTSEWVECLASLRYLRRNILSFNAPDSAVVEALEAKKPHLSNHDANLAALALVEGLFS